jgi:multicomponent Na+:H+ antiporter subunit A
MHEQSTMQPTEYRQNRFDSGMLIALLPLLATIGFATLLDDVARGDNLSLSIPWVTSLGINLSFQVDGLSLLFALIISGIGTLIAIYAGGYFGRKAPVGRFYALLLLFMVAMLGTVTANNLITLFIFWELTSISSYLLIGFNHEQDESRFAALQALLVTGAGGLALLAGLILLGIAGGTFEMSALLDGAIDVRSHALYIPALILVLAGAFTKSAQVPFHFWLPGAMAAPTPVSAYLHSATMVKAGVYLLARLNPVMGGTPAWTLALGTFGGLTMLVGAFLALQHRDLKRILAYSTVSALGTMVLLIGIGTSLALKAMLIFLLAHALYKGALFMVAGTIDHETGTRDITQLGGLRQVMPFTALAAGLAALSMSGLPPFVGFVGKEVVYDAALNAPQTLIVTGVALLTNILTVVAAGMVALRPFFGERQADAETIHEAGIRLWIGPLTLAGLGLGLGLLVGPLGDTLIGPALSAVKGEPATAKLALWHGLNLMLLLSVITVVGGAVLYIVRGRLQLAPAGTAFIETWGPAAWYRRALDGLYKLAKGQTKLLQHGYLRYYLLIIVAVAVALVTAAWLRGAIPVDLPGVPVVWLHEIGLAVLMLAALVAVVRAKSRLAAVAALGVIGFAVGLIYLLFSAPDLAMTQFAVETLTVILLVLVLYRLPRYATFSTAPSRVRDAAIAVGFGVLMTVVVFTMMANPVASPLAEYFKANSVSEAKGSNIVNVILVDFRALDTLGEITVLAVAALGVLALIQLRPGRKS